MTRSRWRVFLTVFLVVFLGGFGVSGAAALWSVKVNATASVTTGTWFSEGFPMPLITDVADWNNGDVWVLLVPTRRGVELAWSPERAVDGLRYTVQGEGCSDSRQAVRRGLPYDGPERKQQVQVTAPLGDAELWIISITPYLILDGKRINAEPTKMGFWVDRYGNVSRTDRTTC